MALIENGGEFLPFGQSSCYYSKSYKWINVTELFKG